MGVMQEKKLSVWYIITIVIDKVFISIINKTSKLPKHCERCRKRKKLIVEH